MPRISILTISFNQAEYLQRCIDSVANQAFDDYEHIIVDPGSSDGSRDLIDAASQSDSHIVVVGEPDRGPADGLNNGLASASGDLVLYLNADDELAPDSLSVISRKHAEDDADVLIGNGWLLTEDGSPQAHVVSDKFSPFLYACGVSTVLQQATSFKSRVFDLGVRFNADNRYNWDTELLFDAYDAGCKFAYIGADLGYFRMQPNSITVSGKYEVGLRAERERLYARGTGRVPRFVSRSLNKPLRLAKRMRASVRVHPRFPGLVRSTAT